MSDHWESAAGVEGYPQTVKRLLLEPGSFFSEIDLAAPLKRALLFAAISLGIGGIAQILWTVVGCLIQIATGVNFQGKTVPQSEVIVVAVATVGFYTLLPLFGIAMAFLGGGITQVCLLLLGSGKSGYLATVKAHLYQSATCFMFLVPICGNLVAPVWGLVIYVIGLMVLHRTTAPRAIGAVVLPWVLCCCCIFLIVAILAAFFGAALTAFFAQHGAAI